MEIEILNSKRIRQSAGDWFEFIIKFNGKIYYVVSKVNYINLHNFLNRDEDSDEDSDEDYDDLKRFYIPSQSDWTITTNVPEVKYLCKELHYHHMSMAQEVNDYIDDHFEEKILDRSITKKLSEIANKYNFRDQ